MRALDAAGDRAGARQHASDHAQRLPTDLDLAPDPDVVALAHQLAIAPARRQPSPNVIGIARFPSIAVLPFLNLSADADNEYFADGITVDVIAHLSKMRALKVISGASVLPFKLRQSTKEIGATLGATAQLDGSVRCAGDRVRIVAKFIDTASDQHLRAETYDRRIDDIFSIQSDVALQIATALQAELSKTVNAFANNSPLAK